MKLYAPRYYKDFKCIADRCRHSCCIGWEIGVDSETVCRYGRLPTSEREEVLSNIEDGMIRLTEEKRCPFLEKTGLCTLISRYGEEYTAQICREHPRFYNFTADHAEVGLGASCEEAARIILSSDGYDELVLVGETEGEAEGYYDSVSERKKLFGILKSRKGSLKDKTADILEKYGLCEELFREELLRERLSGLEYLREEDRLLFSKVALLNKDGSVYSERFLAYLIYRHLTASESIAELSARLAFCIMLQRLFDALLSDGIEPTEAARLISEEIEYSEDNTYSLIFDFECEI